MELSRIAIVGAGASSSTPKLGCVTGATAVLCDDGSTKVDYSTIKCPGCRDAAVNPASRNNRLNPSLLIQLRPAGSANDNATAKLFNILIDCGKTFRESSIKVFPKFGVKSLSALMLTHNHADACFGLDDLREFSSQGEQFKSRNEGSMPLFVFADPETISSMRTVFGYLFPKAVPHNAKGAWVAKLDWRTFEHGSIIDVPTETDADQNVVNSFPMVSFPVEHGNCQCNAYLLELPLPSVVAHNTDDVVPYFLYMSDISKFDMEIDGARLMDSMERHWVHSHKEEGAAKKRRFVVDVLVLDMLGMEPYFAHISRDEAVKLALSIGARQTYFVGMSHTLDYTNLQEHVTKEAEATGLISSPVELGSCYVTGAKPQLFVGYDGCVVHEKRPPVAVGASL